VLQFAEQVEKTIRFLDGAVTGLEEEWDQASEAYAEQKCLDGVMSTKQRKSMN